MLGSVRKVKKKDIKNWSYFKDIIFAIASWKVSIKILENFLSQ